MEALKFKSSDTLDLKQFAWVKDHAWYVIIAVTKFQDQDVVVYRANADGKIEVATVDEFCKTYTAAYYV